MPIMNGFDACIKIKNLFQKDQLFIHEKSLLVKVNSCFNLEEVKAPKDFELKHLN